MIRRRNRSFGLLLIAIGLSLSPWPCRPEDAGDLGKSLATLKKVDEFPLYVMSYVGDYGFKKHLKKQGGAPPRIMSAEPDPIPPWACSCFSLRTADGRVLFGRNFDWYEHAALLLFTDPPDGYASASMVDLHYLGYGREDIFKKDLIQLYRAPEYPFDGMNERGLAVGMLAVPQADGGRDPRKPTLDCLQAIRLMLDYAGNVKEAAARLDDYNVDFEDGPPVHYLVADASGDAAVLEFIGGRLEVLRSPGSFHLATNFLLSPEPPKDDRSVCWRYNTIFKTLSGADKAFSLDKAMALLRDVSQSASGTPTIWSAVFDLKSGEFRIAMGRKFDRVHSWSLRMERAPKARR